MKRAVLFAAACYAAITGCQRSPDRQPEIARAVPATAPESVRLAVGDSFVVALPSNPSTGYRWALSNAPDSATVAPLGGATYVPSSDTPMPGAGGTERFRFMAVSPGTTRLALVYRRSWEPVEPTAKRVAYEVTVVARDAAPTGERRERR